MLVAVSSTGKNLSDQIDPRFGRCAYFLIIDIDNMEFQVFDNESIALGGGAGIQSAQFIASKDAHAVITGNCGPNAVRTLQAAGVELVVGQAGSVEEAVERYKTGRLKTTTEPNVSDHHGMGGESNGDKNPSPDAKVVMEQNISMGRGGGGGMGRGSRCGGGMGRGIGRTGGAIPRGSSSEEIPGALKNNEKEELMEQIKALKDQLNSVTTRIESLGN
jgi:predicted Fe-Mo cluster-binding NifX family protein